MKKSGVIFEPITPTNVDKFKEFIEHREEIVNNLNHGELDPNMTCGDPKCPICKEYLRRMKIKEELFLE